MRQSDGGLAIMAMLYKVLGEQIEPSGSLASYIGIGWLGTIALSDFVRRAKGRSSRKIQQEFEHIRKRYWGQRFWRQGYYSTTSGNITDEVILNYLDKHTKPNKTGFSPKP